MTEGVRAGVPTPSAAQCIEHLPIGRVPAGYPEPEKRWKLPKCQLSCSAEDLPPVARALNISLIGRFGQCCSQDPVNNRGISSSSVVTGRPTTFE
jgi:hypothetical protein